MHACFVIFRPRNMSCVARLPKNASRSFLYTYNPCYLCMFLYTFVYSHIHACMHPCTHTHTHAQTRTHTHARTLAHAHMCASSYAYPVPKLAPLTADTNTHYFITDTCLCPLPNFMHLCSVCEVFSCIRAHAHALAHWKNT